MQQEKAPVSGGTHSLRVLSSRAMLEHHAHVSNGERKNTKKCTLCREGIKGVVQEYTIEVPEDGVLQSGGGDEKKAAPFSYDTWWARALQGELPTGSAAEGSTRETSS